jgi:integrase
VSIERVSRKRGTGWRVRWRDGARNRARTFDRKADAMAYEAEVRRRRRAGDLRPLEAGRETLQEFAEEWWRLYALPNLARTTLASYAALWDAHVLPRLGATPLRELDPLRLAAFRAELTAAGIGSASVRRVMVILQGVLERAVEWQRIPANPARAVRKPAQRRERAVRPLTPLQVERVRAHLLDGARVRDAALVSVLAYAGLRPGEALALTWGHIRERAILVERAVALGDLKTTKTARTRTVRLLAPLASDLREWRIRQGGPSTTCSSSPVAAAPSGPTMRGATGDGASSRRRSKRKASPLPCGRTTYATRSCRFCSPRERTSSRSRARQATLRR